MATAKKTKFEDLLKRDNKSIKADRAKRIAKSATNAQRVKVMGLEQEVMDLEEKLESMTDLSTDNKTTSINKIESFDATTFINTYHSACVTR